MRALRRGPAPSLVNDYNEIVNPVAAHHLYASIGDLCPALDAGGADAGGADANAGTSSTPR